MLMDVWQRGLRPAIFGLTAAIEIGLCKCIRLQWCTVMLGVDQNDIEFLVVGHESKSFGRNEVHGKQDAVK